ncbi:MAG TPA: hypothetical protein VF427_15015 [Noviherbaspirillum sp.]
MNPNFFGYTVKNIVRAIFNITWGTDASFNNTYAQIDRQDVRYVLRHHIYRRAGWCISSARPHFAAAHNFSALMCMNQA